MVVVHEDGEEDLDDDDDDGGGGTGAIAGNVVLVLAPLDRSRLKAVSMNDLSREGFG